MRQDEAAKYTGPFITDREGSTFVTIDMLDKDMVGMLGKMKVGEFSQPTPFESEQGKKGVRVVYLKSRSQPHRMNLQEDYSKISNFALEEKKSKTMSTDHAWRGMGMEWVAMERTRLGFDETVRRHRLREHQHGGYAHRGRRTMARGQDIVLKNYAGALWFRT